MWQVRRWAATYSWRELREEVHASTRHRRRLQARAAAALQGYETRHLLR